MGIFFAEEPPVTPDSDTARQWLEDELKRPEYHSGFSLLERIIQWWNEQIDELSRPLSGTSHIAWLIVGMVIVAAVIVAFLVAGPLRRNPVASSQAIHDEDDQRSAAELVANADRAAQAQDWTTAVLERFRALSRSLEERVILSPQPGRTAQELAIATTPYFPDQENALHHAAQIFDAVRYGDEPATPPHDQTLRDLYRTIATSKPLRSAPAPQGATP